MPAYDPKRPRPSTGSGEEPAPVDALLDPLPSTGSTTTVRIDGPPRAEESGPAPADDSVPAHDPVSSEGPARSEDPVSAEEPVSAAEDPVEVDLRDPSSSGASSVTQMVGSEVPVAAAPDEGTANRAVMIAALTAAGAVALVVAILLLRRRRVD